MFLSANLSRLLIMHRWICFLT